MKLIYLRDSVDLKLIRMFERNSIGLIMLDLHSALESFIRAKYEQRKWIAKDWIPPEITVSSDVSVVLLLRFLVYSAKINQKSDQSKLSVFFFLFYS